MPSSHKGEEIVRCAKGGHLKVLEWNQASQLSVLCKKECFRVWEKRRQLAVNVHEIPRLQKGCASSEIFVAVEVKHKKKKAKWCIGFFVCVR